MVQLEGVKAVFAEPRRAGDDFDSTIRRYYEAVDEGRGGLFMAVCRGKVRSIIHAL
jgi:Fanconi anemia group J protein